jgi:hypothetical protein
MGRYNDYENFKRAAEAHLRHGGIEPDTVDTSQEYDSDISLHENIENFKTQYPVSQGEHAPEAHMTRREEADYERRAAESRMDQIKKASEESRQEKKEMVGEQLRKYPTEEGQEYVYEEKKRAWEKKPEPPKFVEMEKPAPEKKGLLGTLTETFLPNEKVRLAREQETRYQEMKKQKNLEAKLKTSEMKAQTRQMEKQQASYTRHELKESPVGRFASAGAGAANWVSSNLRADDQRPNLMGGGRPSSSLDSGNKIRDLLTSGSSSQNVSNFTISPTALTPGYRYGGQQQQQIKGHYKTIIEGKTARRVRVDQYGNEIPSGYQTGNAGGSPAYRQGPAIASSQSPLMQLMFAPQQPTRMTQAPSGVSGGPSPQPSEPQFLARMITAPGPQSSIKRLMAAPSNQSSIQRMIVGNQNRPFVGAYKSQPQRSAIERLALSSGPGMNIGKQRPGMNIGKQKQAPYMKFMGDIMRPRKR